MLYEYISCKHKNKNIVIESSSVVAGIFNSIRKGRFEQRKLMFSSLLYILRRKDKGCNDKFPYFDLYFGASKILKKV